MAAPITPEDLYRFRWIDHVRLAPDGERVAYQVGWADATSRQNRSRIVVRRLLDPEPIEPTGGALRDHSPEWSPDGARIAFTGGVLSDPEAVVDDPRLPEGREQVRRPPVARVVRRLDYKHDGQGYVDGRYRHLFAVSAVGGDANQLTSGSWDVTDFDWSPDSKRLVGAGNAET